MLIRYVTLQRDAGAPPMRLFHIYPGGSLTLDNVNIVNGSALGYPGNPGAGGGGGGAALNA